MLLLKIRDERDGALVPSLFAYDSWGDVTRSSGWREGGVIIRFSYRVALIQCRKKRYNGVDAER